MTRSIALELPWPPTLNTNVRHAAGRHFKTKEYKAFEKEVWYAVHTMIVDGHRYGGCGVFFMDAPIRMTIHASPPDKRKRDLSNLIKPIEDALQLAGVFEDDFQIEDLRILRVAGKPGTCNVRITELDGVGPIDKKL